MTQPPHEPSTKTPGSATSAPIYRVVKPSPKKKNSATVKEENVTSENETTRNKLPGIGMEIPEGSSGSGGGVGGGQYYEPVTGVGGGSGSNEYLSTAAQTYMQYYSQKYAEAEMRGDEAEMEYYFMISADLREQDLEGRVRGTTLNVPVYNQLNTGTYSTPNNLCWATAAAMWISYLLGDNIDRTREIAVAVDRDIMKKERIIGDPNLPEFFSVASLWQSTNNIAALLGLTGITAWQVQIYPNFTLSEKSIGRFMDLEQPIAVLYGVYNEIMRLENGHWVLGVGYASAPGHEMLVVSNDPWGGVRRIQSISEFHKYNKLNWAETAF